jgi:DNA sulfur modification protein DndB
MWQGNIITDDKISTVRGPGRVAAQAVIKELGIKSLEMDALSASEA